MTVLPPHRHQFLAGHGQAAERLKRSYDDNRLHHAIIIAGPHGIGKETLAYQFMRYALAFPQGRLAAKPVQDDLSVSEDHAANRLINAESHPHIFRIQAVFDEKKQRFKRDITLDALKGLSNFLRLAPPMDAPRFVIINPADGMNKNTQNALLKLLEEPPAATHFLLLTERPGALLPTIRSRCLILQLEALSAKEFALAMQKLNPAMDDAHIHALYSLSGGSPGQAIQDEVIKLYEIYGQFCAAIVQWQDEKDSLSAMRLAESLARPGQEDVADRLIETVSARLAAFIKASVSSIKPDNAIPEEQRLMAIWHGLPGVKALAMHDAMTAAWHAGQTGHLDKKLVILQISQILTGMDR